MSLFHPPFETLPNNIMEDLEDAKKKLAEFKTISSAIIQTDRLLRDLAEKNSECTRLRDELESVRTDLNSASENLKTVTRDYEHLKKANKDLSKEKNELVKKLDDKEALLKEAAQKEAGFNNRLLEYDTQLQAQNKLIEALREELKIVNENYRSISNELEVLKKNTSPRKAESTLTGYQEPKFYLESSSSSFSDSEKNDEDSDTPITRPNIPQPASSTLSFSFSPSLPAQEKVAEKTEKSNDQESSSKSEPDPLKFSLSSSSGSSSSSSDEDDDEESTTSSTSESESDAEKEKTEEATEPIETQVVVDEAELISAQVEREPAEINALDIELEFEAAAAEQKAQEEREELERLDRERRENELVDQTMSTLALNNLDELLDRVTFEWIITEQVRDKLVRDEISEGRQSKLGEELRRVCAEAVDEKRKEIERAWRAEVRERVEIETFEKLLTGCVDSLVRECCERSLIEARNEIANQIYDELLDEVVSRDLVDRVIMEVIFDEMTGLMKPFIGKIEPLRPSKRSHQFIETDILSMPIEKKLKVDSIPSGSQEDWESFQKEIEKFAKDFLASYFRKYNFVVGFTFEELDEMIEKFVDAMWRSIPTGQPKNCYSKLISRILLKHFLNNKYVPLMEQKLNQTDENELMHFKHVRQAMKSSSGQHHRSMGETHLNFIRNKLEQQLTIKIINEEEKYVYLVKKLKEYPGLESLLDEFLIDLKITIFKREFTDSYNFRMGRMLCFLCKTSKHYEFIKSFVYDLIATAKQTMPLLFQNLILQCIRIWPDPFNWPGYASRSLASHDDSHDLEATARSNPILSAVIFIVRDSIVKNNVQIDSQSIAQSHSNPIINYAEYSVYYIYIVETLCNWVLSFKSSDEICLHFGDNLSIDGQLVNKQDLFILNEHEFRPNQLIFEYLSAFGLICAHEAWDWTSNKFLKGFVRLKLAEIKKHRSHKNLELLAFYILLQGFVISSTCPGDRFQKDVTPDILKSYADELLKDYSGFEVVHLAIIESLLSMYPFEPHKCWDLVQTWLNRVDAGVRGNLPLSVKSKIKQVADDNDLPTPI